MSNRIQTFVGGSLVFALAFIAFLFCKPVSAQLDAVSGAEAGDSSEEAIPQGAAIRIAEVETQLAELTADTDLGDVIKDTLTPKPEQALTLTLRCFLTELDYRVKAISELNTEIDRRFKKAKIEIAFPQQDLHVRSVSPEASQGFKGGDAKE